MAGAPSPHDRLSSLSPREPYGQRVEGGPISQAQSEPVSGRQGNMTNPQCKPKENWKFASQLRPVSPAATILRLTILAVLSHGKRRS